MVLLIVKVQELNLRFLFLVRPRYGAVLRSAANYLTQLKRDGCSFAAISLMCLVDV